MRYFYFLIVLFPFIPMLLKAQDKVKFDDFFIDKTMRIDYFHIGDNSSELITLDKIYCYGIWAGSRKNLLDDFNNGKYYVKIYDLATGQLIFSKGFDSYFGEYKTSDEASKGIKRTYHESALIPYPKNKIKFTLELRDRKNILSPIFSSEIDPSELTVIREEPKDKDVKVFEAIKSGDPHNKVDIVILGEGYTKEEESKFSSDLKKFTNIMLNKEPYKTYKDNFNIYGVFKASVESGTDEPDHASFKNTVLNTTFYSLGSERYLLTEDNKSMRDLAAHVPYDAIYIMVNHKRYGGGGIYNLFCTFTTDNQWHEYLFLHEFGHSFAGLADEYYTSDVAYNEFYPQGVEPVEPNITALLNPGQLKWKEQITKGIEIPTPWEKAGYDSLSLEYQKVRRDLNNKIAKMKREHMPENEVSKVEDEAENLSRSSAEQTDKYLENSRFWGKVGAYEGAGYASKGLYRSMLDCLMFSKGNKPFCKVCEQAVIRVIKHYTE
ncbi:MAG: M64 family metallopeptidase [Bacteroidota bacterium]|nr:M64 family metallopeptidase [Bacteroidota bacterium]MDP4191474.1 M64 family metallopeptidase [Bacteroidota bacterium]MDP4195891.1 M64 family metallopeptidase [Bacteroidota bacterium]